MARKKNVAFGANPLLAGPSLVERGRSGSPFREVRLDDIDFDPDQPRRVFDEEGLNELAASIKEYGILAPVLVRALDGGTFRLVAGERRVRAAKMAGLEVVPAVVDLSETDKGVNLAKQLVENLQRRDLSSMERALAIGQLRETEGWSIREIASRLSVSKGFVQRCLEVLALPDDLKAGLVEGGSESKILLLKQVKNEDIRRELLARIDDYSRSQLDEAITSLLAADNEVYHGGTQAQEKKKKPSKLEIRDKRTADELCKVLGTKVRIVRSSPDKKRGRLLIDFYSEEDLKGLYKQLTA